MSSPPLEALKDRRLASPDRFLVGRAKSLGAVVQRLQPHPPERLQIVLAQPAYDHRRPPHSSPLAHAAVWLQGVEKTGAQQDRAMCQRPPHGQPRMGLRFRCLRPAQRGSRVASGPRRPPPARLPCHTHRRIASPAWGFSLVAVWPPAHGGPHRAPPLPHPPPHSQPRMGLQLSSRVASGPRRPPPTRASPATPTATSPAPHGASA